MFDLQSAFTMLILFTTIIFLFWRPFGIHESVPVSIGAIILITAGIVPLTSVFNILGTVSGAAITILSTIIMSIVLESIGFFRWASINVVNKANGSGIALFWYINLLCFLMTLFFNNYGSILITTPIIIQTLALLNLKPQQKIPYLLSGALIATGSSAPIGVSNLANLISLKMVGLDVNSYADMMFIPSMIGIATITLLLLVYFKKDIPKKIPIVSQSSFYRIQQGRSDSNLYGNLHPLSADPHPVPSSDWTMFVICITIVVFIRISFFALAPLGIPTEYPAIAGAILLSLVRLFRKGEGTWDDARKTPWHILLLAFSMYVIIDGLHNVGFTSSLAEQLGPYVSTGYFHAIFSMGLLLTVLSNICNNLPSILIGTLSLTEMGLDLPVLQVSYLANVIGADIGSLLLPMGTLATLIWMVILKKNKIPISWGQYLKAAIFVIPAGLFVSLFCLYVWTQWVMY